MDFSASVAHALLTFDSRLSSACDGCRLLSHPTAFHSFDRLERELTSWSPCTSNSLPPSNPMRMSSNMKNLIVSFVNNASRLPTPPDRSDHTGSSDENMRDCCMDQSLMETDHRPDCNGLCDREGVSGSNDVSTTNGGITAAPNVVANLCQSPLDYLNSSSASSAAEVFNGTGTLTATMATGAGLCLSSSSAQELQNTSEISTTFSSSSSSSASSKGLLSKLNGSFQLTAENKEQLKELLKDGEENAMKKIREFVSRYQLRQQAIAAMTGISQPYVSKFLNGNARDLSDRVRNLMFTWYILCKNSPEKLAELPTDSYNKLSLSDSGELLPQRRERFVFKPVHVRILEKYFQDDPYPNHAKREEIAARCNSAYKAYQLGSDLCPKEQVSEQIISNWFSNRRKEKKRKGELQLRRMRYSSYGEVPIKPFLGQFYSTLTEDNTTVSDQHYLAKSSPSLITMLNAGQTEKQATRQLNDNIQDELAAVSSSVIALVNPYGENDLDTGCFANEASVDVKPLNATKKEVTQ